MSKPDWDLLIVADDEDAAAHSWFPAKIHDCQNLVALEGVRFRNVYLTSRAIQFGSASLFSVLYRSALLIHKTKGHVRHVSDYEEYL